MLHLPSFVETMLIAVSKSYLQIFLLSSAWQSLVISHAIIIFHFWTVRRAFIKLILFYVFEYLQLSQHTWLASTPWVFTHLNDGRKISKATCGQLDPTLDELITNCCSAFLFTESVDCTSVSRWATCLLFVCEIFQLDLLCIFFC